MASEHDDSRDLRIGRILNELLDRQQRGEPVGEQEVLDANPDLADELREHFAMMHQVEPMTSHGRQSGAVAALPRDALPGYEILGEIHRGGQGVVYQAMQKATRRLVAIKVMREGPFAGWRDRARFEREVQVLGALKHPGIVAIHDSGVASGCHYFVMDYVAGASLDAWLGLEQHSITEMLRLFVRICDAVNTAHLKGIIHRDLKPGNIRIDETGDPHILDFGLAKVADAEDREASPADMTAVGQFVGSLPWTSPEQAQGTLDQIDTRTDVYALGVILYQMLTGRFPYEVAGPMRDVLNRIVTVEPVYPTSIRSGIDRDVEAIVLKCLRKERDRRYQTAGEVVRDIERHLAGQPVVARSDSALYVLSRTLRRYRVPAAVVAGFALLIGVSLVASLSLWRQAVVERDRAIGAEHEQNLQRSRADSKAIEAEQARQTAERERTRAEAQAEQLRRTTYLNRIALAQTAYEQKNLSQARHLLEACPAGLRGWEWHYLSRLSRQSNLLDIAADARCVVACDLSRDGHQIVSAGCDGTLKLWDADTGAALTQFAGHYGQVNAVALSPDGLWIASGGRDQTLRLWDARTGASHMLQEGEQSIYCVAFSPDSTSLVAGGQSRTLTYWNVSERRLLRASPAQDGEISCVAFTPDGTRLVSGEFVGAAGSQGKLRVWDAATGQQLREIVAHPAGVLSIAIAPDGRHVASGSSIPARERDARGTLKVFDLQTGEETLSLPGHEGFVEAVRFSPDGKLLASAGSPRSPAGGMEADRTLKIWDAVTGGEVCTYSAHDGGGRTLAWSPDSTRVFSGGMDGKLKSWPSSTPPECLVLRGHSGAVLRIAFSPDGQQIASAGGQGESNRLEGVPADNSIRVWDATQGGLLYTLVEHKNAVLALAWSPDGEYIASGGADHTIRVWNAHTGTRAFLLASSDGEVKSTAFSPDSQMLAAVAGNTAGLWSVVDRTEYWRLRHADALQTAIFSPDDRWLATASTPGVVRVWDRHTTDELPPILTGPDLTGAWFSPDSATIATAHSDGTIHLSSVVTGGETAVLAGPSRSVQWLDFSPDGQRIVSCSNDMMLTLWDVRTASEVYTFRAHNTPVTCVKFSPDGNRIAAATQDGLVKIWDGK